MTINLSEHAGGGRTKYAPGMVDVSAGYYSSASITTTDNKITLIVKFKEEAFTGAGSRYIAIVYRGSDSVNIVQVLMYSSDFADAEKAGTIRVLTQNTGATLLCLLHSFTGYIDGNEHTLVYTFDGDNGIAQYTIDGIDVDNTGHTGRTAPIVGTLPVSADTRFSVGGHSTTPMLGAIGYFAFDDSYTDDTTIYYHPEEGLQEVDLSSWLYWNEQAYMADNLGTAGNMTVNGTIVPAYGQTATFPHLGINTIGDAVAADIAVGKIAWVDGVEITGTG